MFCSYDGWSISRGIGDPIYQNKKKGGVTDTSLMPETVTPKTSRAQGEKALEMPLGVVGEKGGKHKGWVGKGGKGKGVEKTVGPGR